MNRAARIALEVVLLAVAAWQVADIAFAVHRRFGANFDIEWMEGATLLTGLRASQGLPFYGPPSPDYIPFIYPPLYAWVLGWLSKVLPFGYALGRGISITSTLVSMGVLVAAARREGARWALAIGAAVLFLGCYEDGGTFYDLVRIDALALALTAIALLLGRQETRVGGIASGLMLTLAFTAKHNMAMLGLPIFLWRWRTLGRRDAWTFAAASALPALAFTVAMQVHTDGYFLTYLLSVPAHHGLVYTRLLPNLDHGHLEGAQAELWRALPLTTTVGLVTAGLWGRTRGGAYWAAVSGVALVMVSLMRGHTGGFVNVLIPMFWLLALLPVLAERALAGTSGWRAWVPHLFTALVALQIWQGKANLFRYVPTKNDFRNAAALIDELRAMPEPILMPHAPYYPVLAGKSPSFALITMWDIDHKGGPLVRSAKAVQHAIAAQHWATVITPDDKLGFGLTQHYTKAGKLKTPAFGTHTGWRVRFGLVWHPKKGDLEATPPGASDDAYGGEPSGDPDGTEASGGAEGTEASSGAGPEDLDGADGEQR
jgi:hypothetical protein